MRYRIPPPPKDAQSYSWWSKFLFAFLFILGFLIGWAWGTPEPEEREWLEQHRARMKQERNVR